MKKTVGNDMNNGNKKLALGGVLGGCLYALGLALGAVLPSPIKAISYGMRNLGEGLMYLIPLAYWKAKE